MMMMIITVTAAPPLGKTRTPQMLRVLEKAVALFRPIAASSLPSLRVESLEYVSNSVFRRSIQRNTARP